VSHLETCWDIQLELPLGLELAHELGHLVLHNAIFTKGDGSSDDLLKWVSGATTLSRRKATNRAAIYAQYKFRHEYNLLTG
jgi:hypothetical protein